VKLLIVALLGWIAAHSDHSLPNTQPDVVAMTQVDFELYLCEQMMQCDSPAPLAEILALFDFDSRTIYVRQGFDPANREHQSTMVRQLVHFLQALAGRSQICRGVLIQDARKIESYWRVAHDLPPLSASPLGMLLESCGPGPT
jgi:hypothetical protein